MDIVIPGDVVQVGHRVVQVAEAWLRSEYQEVITTTDGITIWVGPELVRRLVESCDY